MASGCSLFRGKNVRKKRGGDAKSVRCSEFRGGRFSEVANVLHKRDFQSVIATLSAVGSVSASRSVRSGRFYCIPWFNSYKNNNLSKMKGAWGCHTI